MEMFYGKEPMGEAILSFSPARAQIFLNSARVANAIPCRVRIIRGDDGWQLGRSGWGLVHAQTNEPIDPPALVDDEQIEMTDWELHDFAVQVVREYLPKVGKTPAEWQCNLGIDPSLWFQDGDRFCWAVVRAVRYPEAEAPRPENPGRLIKMCGPYRDNGFFASVAVANVEDPFDGSPPLKLYRGCGMHVRFTGLEPIRGDRSPPCDRTEEEQ